MSLPAFGVRNPVPVNLLMAATVIIGLYSVLTMRREFFPEVDSQVAYITMVYPGATPEEIEESMVFKVEEALDSIDEIKRIKTTISEGYAGISAEFNDGVNVQKTLDEIERTLDRVQDLPADAERIQITELVPNMPAIQLNLWGDTNEEELKRGLRRIKEDLESLPGMGSLLETGVRQYEISVDVDSQALLENGLSMPMVSDVISAWMSELPSGTLKTGRGNINVRTVGVDVRSDSIKSIVLRANPDGSLLTVADVAEVVEGYIDVDIVQRFNGEPAADLTVFREGSQDAIEISSMVKSYVRGRNQQPFDGSTLDRLMERANWKAWSLGASSLDELPGTLSTSTDLSRFIQGRLELLTRNASQGAVLVFLALFLVLNIRTSLWVMIGLITAVAGTLVAMYFLGITLNLLTMFGLLVTLGMLTDDAIVVAENIQAEAEGGDDPEAAAVRGGNQVAWPVLGTVSTTIVAFIPLLFIQGQIGDLMGALPWVVVCALASSYIESILILPSHMAHAIKRHQNKKPGRIMRRLDDFSDWRDRVLLAWIIERYTSFTRKALNYRYITTATALGLLVISLGLVTGRRVPFEFLPVQDAENMLVEVRMPTGTSLEKTSEFIARIENIARKQDELAAISTTIGSSFDIATGAMGSTSTNNGQIFLELKPIEQRERSSGEVVESIRLEMGDVSEADEVSFTTLDGGPGGKDITIRIAGADRDAIMPVVHEVEDLVKSFDGILSVSNDDVLGQKEIRVHLRPGAAALGFTVVDISLQLRAALYGLDAHVFSENREDIDVRVRLDADSRNRLQDLEQMWILSPAGALVPLYEVARLEEAEGYTTIKRIDRQRAINVFADTDVATSPEELYREMIGPLAAIEEKWPEIQIRSGGRQADVAEAFSTLPVAFGAALLMIYVILAWLFASYFQPIAVMLAIPFGFIGVIWGHLLLGFEMTFLSLIGVVALAGIVVNNSLILIDFFNKFRRNGLPLIDALLEAGRRRLRPIVLTTATTVLGLSPLMLEQSFQARFLIPMAISITAGLVSSTALTLIVLPAIIVILDDVNRLFYRLWFGVSRPENPVTIRPYEADDDPDD